MKKVIFVCILVATAMVSTAGNNGKLGIGDKPVYTEVKMDDVSGSKISLADVKKENGLLVLFSSNTCPFVMQWEGRYPDLKAWADKNKVGMVVLNSNHQKRDGDDSFEAMKKHAKEKGYNFYYALDDQSLIANTFAVYEKKPEWRSQAIAQWKRVLDLSSRNGDQKHIDRARKHLATLDR